MNVKMANQIITLLKQGKKYRDGLSNLFVELSYEDPHFIKYEYHGDGFNGDAHSLSTKFTEKEMFEFILRPI